MSEKQLKIVAKDDHAEIFLYEEVGSEMWGGISAKTFAKQLAAVKESKITLRINSPGGDAFDGLAMANTLAEHPAEVTARVDGLAASAATLPMVAADRVEIASNAMIMIHRASTSAHGTSQEMTKMAEVLASVDEQMVKTYNHRELKVSAEELDEMLDAETWMTASEATEFGFADAIADSMDVAASVTPGRYKKTPEAFLAKSSQITEDQIKIWRRMVARHKLLTS